MKIIIGEQKKKKLTNNINGLQSCEKYSQNMYNILIQITYS